jgi:hypothetical protein
VEGGKMFRVSLYQPNPASVGFLYSLQVIKRLVILYALRVNINYVSIKSSTRLCTEFFGNNSGWTKAGEGRLQKICADEPCKPQPVYVMKYWAALNPQPKRKQY